MMVTALSCLPRRLRDLGADQQAAEIVRQRRVGKPVHQSVGARREDAVEQRAGAARARRLRCTPRAKASGVGRAVAHQAAEDRMLGRSTP